MYYKYILNIHIKLYNIFMHLLRKEKTNLKTVQPKAFHGIALKHATSRCQ